MDTGDQTRFTGPEVVIDDEVPPSWMEKRNRGFPYSRQDFVDMLLNQSEAQDSIDQHLFRKKDSLKPHHLNYLLDDILPRRRR
jgi:hypothetical protein